MDAQQEEQMTALLFRGQARCALLWEQRGHLAFMRYPFKHVDRYHLNYTMF